MGGYRAAVKQGAEFVIGREAARLGALLRDRRSALGISQQALAAKVPDPALDGRGLGKAERGERDVGEGTWIAWHAALSKLEAKRGPAPNPDHARFLDAFGELWRAEHHASGPSYANAGRLHKDLKAALAAHGYDELLRRARLMFESSSGPGAFPLVEASDKNLSTLLRHLDLFVTARGHRPAPARLPEREARRSFPPLSECEP